MPKDWSKSPPNKRIIIICIFIIIYVLQIFRQIAILTVAPQLNNHTQDVPSCNFVHNPRPILLIPRNIFQD